MNATTSVEEIGKVTRLIPPDNLLMAEQRDYFQNAASNLHHTLTRILKVAELNQEDVSSGTVRATELARALLESLS